MPDIYSKSSRLNLDDSGWKIIDDAAIGVTGDVKDIVVKMGSILMKDQVRGLCRGLGILSSGFLFFDVLKDLTRFYKEDQAPTTYRTEYVWTSQPPKGWMDLVHYLFVHVRSLVQVHATNMKKRTEDYFRYVPKDASMAHGLMEADTDFRNKYQCHYVTLGETLFTMLAWRTLQAAAGEPGGSAKPLGDLNVRLDQEYSGLRMCTWNGQDLLAPPDKEWTSLLREAWKSMGGEKACLKRDWENLGLISKNKAPSSVGRFAVDRFTREIAELNDGTFQPEDDDNVLNEKIQGRIVLFLGKLGFKKSDATVGDALKALESLARFPILPFYVWQALDGTPKCYMVSPVWTSQQHWVTVDDADCRHLGLALSAVSPLSRVDWTLPRKPAHRPRYLSNADPLVILNLLRLMARPLVEGQLYHSMARELKEQIVALSKDMDGGVNRAIGR